MKGSKLCGSISGAMPTPVSRTSMATKRPAGCPFAAPSGTTTSLAQMVSSAALQHRTHLRGQRLVRSQTLSLDEHDGQEVVEVVGDAARRAAERLQPLHLLQELLAAALEVDVFALGLAPRTVKDHSKNLYRKLRGRSRNELKALLRRPARPAKRHAAQTYGSGSSTTMTTSAGSEGGAAIWTGRAFHSTQPPSAAESALNSPRRDAPRSSASSSASSVGQRAAGSSEPPPSPPARVL
jgi:hypothetical protein